MKLLIISVKKRQLQKKRKQSSKYKQLQKNTSAEMDCRIPIIAHAGTAGRFSVLSADDNNISQIFENAHSQGRDNEL